MQDSFYIFIDPESRKTLMPKLFLLDPNAKIIIISTTQKSGPKLKTRRRHNSSERGDSLITCQQNGEIKQYKENHTKTTNTSKGRQRYREK
jgi:hypothetical protein